MQLLGVAHVDRLWNKLPPCALGELPENIEVYFLSTPHPQVE